MADRTDQRPTSARIALPGRPASVATARRFIEARNAAWSFPEPAGAKLVLIGSELVTNAILHARTELTLTLELRDGRVRISVRDRSRSAAALRHYQADALTGRGLGVVAALSDSWGISATAAGKVVWAEVAASGNAAGTGAQRPPEEVGRLPRPRRPPSRGWAPSASRPCRSTATWPSRPTTTPCCGSWS